MTHDPARHTAYAPGKLLLFGEHAAVYGHPALGMAIDRGITVSIEERTSWTFTPVDGVDPSRFARFADHVDTVLGSDAARGHVHIDSNIPLSAGFGSSAALCAALAKAAIPDIEGDRHWQRAHSLERFFHGTPSGIDTGLSVLGGVRLFTFESGEGELPRAKELGALPATIVAGSIPRTGSTGSLVAGIRRRVERGDAACSETLRRLGAVALAAGESLRHGDADAESIGALAGEAHHLLASLELSTPAVDAILSAARDAGATGAKISGAGGGGALYAVFYSPEAASAAVPHMAAAAERAGIDRSDAVFFVVR